MDRKDPFAVVVVLVPILLAIFLAYVTGLLDKIPDIPFRLPFY